MKPQLRLEAFLEALKTTGVGVHRVDPREYVVWVGGKEGSLDPSGVMVEMESDACWMHFEMSLETGEEDAVSAMAEFRGVFGELVGDDLVDLELERTESGWKTVLVADFGKVDECIEWVERAVAFGLTKRVV